MKQFAKELLVRPGSRIKLDDVDAADTHGTEKSAAEEQLAKNLDRLRVLQYLLYAEGHRSLLVVLQGIDAGGKDGTIQHVMSGLNPQGIHDMQNARQTLVIAKAQPDHARPAFLDNALTFLTAAKNDIFSANPNGDF